MSGRVPRLGTTSGAVLSPNALTQEFASLLDKGPVLVGGAAEKIGFAFGETANNYGVIYWDATTGEVRISFVSGATLIDPLLVFSRSGSTPLLNLPGRIGKYRNVDTVKAGIPSELAAADLLA